MVYLAPNQTYTKEYLKILKDEYGIFFDGDGCHAFKVIPRANSNPLIQLFTEDDGNLAASDITFDVYWAKYLMESLQLAVSEVDKKKMWYWPERK